MQYKFNCRPRYVVVFLFVRHYNDLYFSPNNVTGDKIEKNEMGGKRNTNGGGRVEMYTEFWWGNQRERDHIGDPGVDGRIILKWVFMKWDGGRGLFLACSEHGQVVGTCECGNEVSGSIKCGEFLDYWKIG